MVEFSFYFHRYKNYLKPFIYWWITQLIKVIDLVVTVNLLPPNQPNLSNLKVQVEGLSGELLNLIIQWTCTRNLYLFRMQVLETKTIESICSERALGVRKRFSFSFYKSLENN